MTLFRNGLRLLVLAKDKPHEGVRGDIGTEKESTHRERNTNKWGLK